VTDEEPSLEQLRRDYAEVSARMHFIGCGAAIPQEDRDESERLWELIRQREDERCPTKV